LFKLRKFIFVKGQTKGSFLTQRNSPPETESSKTSSKHEPEALLGKALTFSTKKEAQGAGSFSARFESPTADSIYQKQQRNSKPIHKEQTEDVFNTKQDTNSDIGKTRNTNLTSSLDHTQKIPGPYITSAKYLAAMAIEFCNILSSFGDKQGKNTDEPDFVESPNAKAVSSRQRSQIEPPKAVGRRFCQSEFFSEFQDNIEPTELSDMDLNDTGHTQILSESMKELFRQTKSKNEDVFDNLDPKKTKNFAEILIKRHLVRENLKIASLPIMIEEAIKWLSIQMDNHSKLYPIYPHHIWCYNDFISNQGFDIVMLEQFDQPEIHEALINFGNAKGLDIKIVKQGHIRVWFKDPTIYDKVKDQVNNSLSACKTSNIQHSENKKQTSKPQKNAVIYTQQKKERSRQSHDVRAPPASSVKCPDLSVELTLDQQQEDIIFDEDKIISSNLGPVNPDSNINHHHENSHDIDISSNSSSSSSSSSSSNEENDE
jgi:hypothetical protein